MDWKTLAIVIAFIALFVLLLWLIINVHGKWWLKLFAIVGTLSFCLVVWNALGSYLGWPASPPLPRKAIFIWAEIQEPDPRSGDPGAIYLWLVAIQQKESDSPNPLAYFPEAKDPRAYRLPYSRELHEALLKALWMRGRGRTVIMDDGEGEASGDESDEGDGAEGGDGRGGEGQAPYRDRRFYELPPPKLPDKDFDKKKN